MAVGKATPRILADYDKGLSHTEQKGVHEYGMLDGIIARISGVGVAVTLRDPITNSTKSTVVNRRSLEEYCKRNDVEVQGKNSQQLATAVNDMLSKKVQERAGKLARRAAVPVEIKEIMFTSKAISMSVGELRKFFSALQGHGLPDQARMLRELAGKKSDDDEVTLTATHLKVLKGPAEQLYRTMTKGEEAKSTKNAVASLADIKAFIFDQDRVEMRLIQLMGSDCQHILEGGLASKDRAEALLEKISPKKAEREKLINNPMGVVKNMTPEAKNTLRNIINKAGHIAKF